MLPILLMILAVGNPGAPVVRANGAIGQRRCNGRTRTCEAHPLAVLVSPGNPLNFTFTAAAPRAYCTRADGSLYLPAANEPCETVKNVLLQTEDLSASAWAKTSSSVTAHEIFPNSSTSGRVTQSFSGVAGPAYIAATLVSDGPAHNAQVQIYDNTTSTNLKATSCAVSSTPVECSAIATSVPAGHSIGFLIYADVSFGVNPVVVSNARAGWADLVQPYCPSGATNGVCLGPTKLHMRPQIADLLIYSNDFTTWALGGSPTPTVTTNAAIAPNGTTSASHIVESATPFNVKQTIAVVASTNYHWDFYVKDGGGADAQYAVYCDSTAAYIVPPTSYKSQISTTSWTRITVPFTTPVGCTTASVYPLNQSAAADEYVWGGQVTQSSMPLDFCPSGASPATCNAETATVPRPSGLSLTEGCAKVCVTPTWTGNNPLTDNIFWLTGNAGSTSRIAYTGGTHNSVDAYDGTRVARGTAISFTPGTRVCSLTQWDATGGTLTVTDLSTAQSTTATGFTGFPSFDSTLHIGSDGAGAGQPLGAGIDTVVLGDSPWACQ